MDKPKCRLCGSNHSPKEPHVFPEELKVESHEPVWNDEVAEKVQRRASPAERSKLWREKNRERYNESKKLQMRKLRKHVVPPNSS